MISDDQLLGCNGRGKCHACGRPCSTRKLLCEGCYTHEGPGLFLRPVLDPPPFKGSQGRTDAQMQSDATGFALFVLTVIVIAGWLTVAWGLWVCFS